MRLILAIFGDVDNKKNCVKIRVVFDNKNNKKGVVK